MDVTETINKPKGKKLSKLRVSDFLHGRRAFARAPKTHSISSTFARLWKLQADEDGYNSETTLVSDLLSATAIQPIGLILAFHRGCLSRACPIDWNG